MKKHVRLWSVVLTAFMLIGVMAAVALAADQVTITGGTGKLPKGNVYIGDKFTKLTFKVSFDSSADQKAAKIKWKATNLPAGLKLTAKDATATLEGTYSKASKSVDDEKNTYEITATDSVSGFEWTSGDTVVIWGKPEFKTDTTKALSAKTGEKGIKFKIDTKNPVLSYDVEISKDKVTAESGFKLKPGTSMILIDDEKSKSNSIAFTGSFDRVVPGGKELTMTVTIKVPSGDIKETYGTNDWYAISKDFKIKITGVAPKFAKGDFSFEKGGDDSFDFTLSAGTPDIQWKAYIDEKTVQKLTGDKKAKQIDLPSADKKYDPFTKLGFIASTDGTSRIVFDLTSVDKVAFKKLPVTVEAWNDEINKTKHSKGKLTVTVDGTAPYLTLNGANAATLHPAGETSYDKTVSMDEIDNKVELKVKAGASFDAFTISVDGGQPIAITVKPEKKNGIVAKISGDAVYFSGTTDKATKDTTTKFSVEAKNNSTGAKAKADVIITAVPKPTLASGQSTIAPKAVVWGKTVKAAPKLAATNKNVKWLLVSISDDKWKTAADIASNDEAQEAAIASLDKYGLEFDSAKGVLSAKKIAYVTGKDNPIAVTFYANGDIESSDLVTANFTVLGEAVKVTTKGPIKLSVSSKDMQEVKLADLMIETNLKDVTSGEKRASVDWTLDLKGIKEITSASVTRSGDVGGYATLSVDLNTAKVAKKVTLPITFQNYGTKSTGKITVAIGGATPIISADKVTVAKAGGNGKTTVKITNSSLVSDKLKWKIETKPTVKGITASLKADKAGTTATLEIKVGDKVEAEEDTVTVSVTDSVTKLTSETIDIPITITTPYVPEDDGSALEADETSSALEADDTASSKEAKVLGEGTVTMGHQRTVASLTAGQRAQIEAQGYIVAAVLPEIEVDADGQYDFEVDLDADERVKAGDELVWFAFASKPTTDDEIVDFEDLDGNETKVVPEIAEGHEHPVVVAWPWLNAGTKYAPVIAVKADAAEADAMTEEGVKEAAEEAKEE